MTVSRKLDAFFKHIAVDALLLILIAVAVVVAILSLFTDQGVLEGMNLVFSVVFAIELTARYFTYTKSKREYFADWWLDWIATIPWDLLLIIFFPEGGAAVLRLLRLPRIFRLLRFRYIRRSDFGRILIYRFHRLLEVSIFRQVLAMLLVSFVLIVAFSFILDYLSVESEHGSNFWFATISLMSSDSIFEVQEMSTVVKALVLAFAFTGIVLFDGVLLAIIIGKLMDNLAELKSGRGDVREKGHVVLLGWDECIPHIIDQLSVYCRSERKRLMKVVVMRESTPSSPKQIIESRPNVEVISRIGSFQNEEALERISAHKARAVVVLGGQASDRNLFERLNDPVVTRTLVAMETLLDSQQRSLQSPVIILNYLDLTRSHHVTEFLKPFGNRSTKVFFNPLFFTGKLIASMCVNPYAGDIVNDLVTAQGNSFHFIPLPREKTMIWRDLLRAFPKAVPVGYKKADGALCVIPLADEPLPKGAEILALCASSSDGAVFTPVPPPSPPRSSLRCSVEPPQGTVVIVGVNPKLPFIIEEMKALGMDVLVIDNQKPEEFAAWYEAYASKTQLSKGVPFKECRFRSEAEVLAVIDHESTKRIILLADGHLLEEVATPDQIDAETTSKLLLLSHIMERLGHEDLHIIVETLTVDSEVIVRNIRNCANEIGPLTTGRLLRTFALQPELHKLLETIVQYGEIDIACRPAAEAIPDWAPETFTYADLLARVAPDCIPLGWVDVPPLDRDSASNGKLRRPASMVKLNPPRDSLVPEHAELVFLHRHRGCAGDRAEG